LNVVAGTQAEVRWQAAQEAIVAMCFADFPVAITPLWQVAQAVGSAFLWLNFAGVQAAVVWQESQEAVVRIWLADLPAALLPLWQVAQVPGGMPECEKIAGDQALVWWQVSQGSAVGMCVEGLAVPPILLPATWQFWH